LKNRTATEATTHNHRVKIDPGSRFTGLAIVQENTNRVVRAAEIEHRGWQVHKRMQSRAQVRRARRGRKTRYHKPRILNQGRPKGWLPPSL
jgi:hypothetical protein